MKRIKAKYKVVDENGNIIGKYKTLKEAQSKLVFDMFCYWHIEVIKE